MIIKTTRPIIQPTSVPVDIEVPGALLSIVDIEGFVDMEEFPVEVADLSGP